MPVNHLIPGDGPGKEEVRKAVGLGCLRPKLPQNPAGGSMWQGPEWMGHCAPSMADSLRVLLSDPTCHPLDNTSSLRLGCEHPSLSGDCFCTENKARASSISSWLLPISQGPCLPGPFSSFAVAHLCWLLQPQTCSSLDLLSHLVWMLIP